MADFRALAAALNKSSDYRVLSRVARNVSFHPEDGKPKRKGLLVDVETTGLDTASDVIIELGCILFEYGLDGTVYRIIEEYNGLEDPHQPLDPEIIKLTGITDEEVRNQSLDDVEVIRLIDAADFVIAHNAAFDRRMLERRFVQFTDKPWGCSVHSVNWQEEGIGSAKLDYILFKLGKFHEGHRAVEDCHATLFILSAELPESKTTALAQILQQAREPDRRVFAYNASYEIKDVLKSRGYKWSDGSEGKVKSWYIDVSLDDLNAEIAFLADGVVIGRSVPVLVLEPKDIYTDRVFRLPSDN